MLHSGMYSACLDAIFALPSKGGGKAQPRRIRRRRQQRRRADAAVAKQFHIPWQSSSCNTSFWLCKQVGSLGIGAKRCMTVFNRVVEHERAPAISCSNESLAHLYSL